MYVSVSSASDESSLLPSSMTIEWDTEKDDYKIKTN